ncbi:copper amine oxidase N-terminal domain protein [Peptoniphilus sp. oral taxon 375 str. F0436]|nr:copper amine oxidase N-terminal domain protein [Peptoniphilus sp. oral taxon 375 str. F0436]KGF11507.1 hypothetical protein HMPREF1633_05710 [Tissierellia bacterium S5-A11]
MIPSIKNERSTSVKKKYLAIGLLTTSLLLTNNVMAKTDIQGGVYTAQTASSKEETTKQANFTFDKELHTITKYLGRDKNVVIPKEIDGVAVEHIGSQAFDGNSFLESVTIPEGIKTIGDRAFADTSLKELSLPSSLSKIEKSAFTENSKLTKVIISDNVREIPVNAFEHCSGLKELKLPEKLEKIDKGAFKNCKALEKISIPGQVREINESAFTDCKNLTSIVVEKEENSIPGFPWGAQDTVKIQWKQKENTGEVTSQDFQVDEATGTLTKYTGKAESVTVPSEINGVKIVKIGEGAFEELFYLKHVVLPDGITELADSAFDNDQFLESVRLPDTITKIGNHVFDDCSRLKDINIPKNLKEIGDYAFAECAFESIVIPDTVTKIGASAFADAVNLKKVVLPKNIEVLEERVLNASHIEEIVIPDKVTHIKARAFANATKLKKITLPKNLKYVGDTAFGFTKIEEIILPNGVKELDGHAFGYMAKLKKVCIPASIEKISPGAFELSTDLKEIHIAREKDAIKGAPWGENEAKVFWEGVEKPATPETPKKPETPKEPEGSRPSSSTNRKKNYNTFYRSSSKKENDKTSKYSRDVRFIIGKNTFTVIKNGKEETIFMDVSPFVENNRTMLPLRFIAESLGMEVKWDQEKQTAHFSKDGRTASIYIYDNKIALSNGETVPMDANPTIKKNRIFVSLTNISKVFNISNGNTKDGTDQDIEWNPEDNSISIKLK